MNPFVKAYFEAHPIMKTIVLNSKIMKKPRHSGWIEQYVDSKGVVVSDFDAGDVAAGKISLIRKKTYDNLIVKFMGEMDIHKWMEEFDYGKVSKKGTYYIINITCPYGPRVTLNGVYDMGYQSLNLYGCYPIQVLKGVDQMALIGFVACGNIG